MEVRFRRVGARRYAVSAHRPGRPTLEMDPAPGYDDAMPHDLVHFAVERALGIRRGIFGQLAAGGTAGTFRLAEAGAPPRERARASRDLARRSERLAREGRADAARSEVAAQACYAEWRARAADGGQSRREAAGDGISREELDRACALLDRLGARWARLEVGQSLALAWDGADDAGE